MATELIFRQLFDKTSSTYTYLLADSNSREALIIDPVLEHCERDLQLIHELDLTLKYILDTHIHADHITGAASLKKHSTATIVSSKEANIATADHYIQDGDSLSFGDCKLQAIYTPGHTDTCYTYLVEDMLFTGDALMIRGCGRTDFQSGSAQQLYHSITQKLFTLPRTTKVYPGHNYRGMLVSTIAEEIKNNPRLGQGKSLEQFVDIMNNLNLDPPKMIDIAIAANLRSGLVV